MNLFIKGLLKEPEVSLLDENLVVGNIPSSLKIAKFERLMGKGRGQTTN